ncbi:MAG: hypothetical protein GY755_07710 [Chloroflexi bacterium]|nr:hypothetical protein [Chloroflexota bacterium]
MMGTKYVNIFSRGSISLLLMALLVSILPAGAMAAPGNITRSPVETSGGQFNSYSTFTQLSLYPNIETIGVVVSGVDLPKTAELMYRQNNETIWQTGHRLMRIDDGRLVGSLFELSPATAYSIKVVGRTAEISASISTQPEELQFIPSAILHVDDDAAPGGDGSASTPFQNIQDGVNHATPGTKVLVADGIYHEEITFPTSGSVGNWIQVKAEGNGALLDGSKTFSGNIWRPYSKAKIWFMRVENSFEYLARDQQRFYNYRDLQSLLNKPRGDGWYLDHSTSKLYVRSHDNPSNHTWQVPHLNHAFDVDSRDWLWIEGFEMQFYGTGFDGCGVCAKNASHIVIRKNKIHNMQLGIYINWTGGEERGNDTRIEYNEIYDPPVNEWLWDNVKGSSMEGTAIVLRGHIGAIVRGNELHHFFNGIYTGSSGALENPALAFDIDVYNNHIHHISDDALEPEGACINHRFRNNIFNSTFVGVSVAPVTIGPAWVLRSTFANYTGRGIKWANNSDGIVLIYHNTFWTMAQDIAAMDFITPAHNTILRNNIFQNNGYAVYEVRAGSTNHDWDNNNWYPAHSPHFRWENIDFATAIELCAATGLACNSHENYPGLTNLSTGSFTLDSSSSNIDRGAIIPGINDGFSGSAPDIGTYEYISTVTLSPKVLSILRADSNPTDATSVNFIVGFSEPVTGVSISPPFNDFTLTTSPSIIDAAITSVAPISGTTYTVNVDTGSGSGNIRLDLVDDNSILNTRENPLGGISISDGNFNTGEVYTIRIAPTVPKVTGILSDNPNPTSSDNITLSLTFSESVTGVDTSDFFLATTGNITGAALRNISGSGNKYTVSIFTGNGNGSLRLDILDNDSIINRAGYPLGGMGAGNGNFNTGEVYTIDRTAPIVTGSLRTNSNPTTADKITFLVGFTEAVSGVDASDFSLSSTGNIINAVITSINGSDNMYTITAGTGSGSGTLRLDILDNDSIVDTLGNPLGGAGTGNGNFTTGEEYTINKIPVKLITEAFTSNGKNDGYVLESSENSNQGGAINAKATTLVLGDSHQNSQYRSILQFPTHRLPNNSVITEAVLMIKKYDMAGTNPFATHQNILVDIRYGAFGSIPDRSLQSSDFQSPSCLDAVATIQNIPIGDWYWAFLDSSAFNCINRYGITQLRLRFQLDDNNNMTYDYLRFYSGDDILRNRPRLIIKYYRKR